MSKLYEYKFKDEYTLRIFEVNDLLYKLKNELLSQALVLIRSVYSAKNSRKFFSQLFTKDTLTCFLFKKNELIGITSVKKHRFLNKTILFEFKLFIIDEKFRGTSKLYLLMQYTFINKYVNSIVHLYNKIYFFIDTKNKGIYKLMNLIFENNNLKENLPEDVKLDLEILSNSDIIKKWIENGQYLEDWEIKNYALGNRNIHSTKLENTILFFAEYDHKNTAIDNLRIFVRLEQEFPVLNYEIKNNIDYPLFLPSAQASHNENHSIAIIDSGINKEIFKYQIRNGVSISYDSNIRNITITDDYEDHIGHGSYMSSIIRNSSDENVQFEVIKIANGSEENHHVLCLIEGIKWAIKKNVKLINISATVKKTKYLDMLEAVCNDAKNNNIIIVCSIDPFTIEKSYPFEFESTIGVGLSPHEGTLFFDPIKNIIRLNFIQNGKENSSSATAYVTGLLYNLIRKHPEFENYQNLISYLRENCITQNDLFWSNH